LGKAFLFFFQRFDDPGQPQPGFNVVRLFQGGLPQKPPSILYIADASRREALLD
jgi:hypothetical protein